MRRASTYAKEKATKGDKEAKYDGFGVYVRHLEGFKWDRTTWRGEDRTTGGWKRLTRRKTKTEAGVS